MASMMLNIIVPIMDDHVYSCSDVKKFGVPKQNRVLYVVETSYLNGFWLRLFRPVAVLSIIYGYNLRMRSAVE